ncbi:MAG: flagellar biosynthesis regulator FlhF [Cereibacter sp.]|jgi:flagellar protein FlaF|nr:flagellar biosynthesis regulator FlhF [Cereibacter sp.]
MSTAQMARLAYSRPEAPARTARGVEYDLLARITQKLSQSDQQRSEDYAVFAAALQDNLRLWATFAADVADNDNGLPRKLRAQLFNLYRFIDQYSLKVLGEGGSVAVLIDINTAVMRGLRGDGGRG